MKASATGLEMAGRENVGARLNLTAGKEVTEIDVVVDDGVTTFADVDLRIPARLEVYPPSWSPVEGPLVGAGLFSELQIAWERLVPGARPDQILVLDGALELGGTAKHPTMQSDLTARFPSDPSRPDYVLNLQARLERSAEGDSTGGSEGLFAVVRLDRGASTVLTGSLDFPMTFGSGIRPDSTRTIEMEIESEPLRLEEFNPLFPTDYTMKGLVDLDFKATGPLDDPVLEGSLVVSELDVSVARGGNVAGHADIRFSGTGLRPRVDGTVDVIGGVIPIPEDSRDLLPDEGQAVLWETQGLPPLTANPEDTSGAGGSVTPTVEPEIDVTIRIPSSLWIRGRQIDIELSGDLRIEYGGGVPVITGTLKTRGGRLTLFGRTFTPERGEVTFFGDDEFNPSLDIRLTTRIEQYEIIVTITGTTEEPKLDLSSIPDLDQGDIMSVLTFGKPSSELDGDQLELAAQRAAAMAAMHGAAEVSGALADPLGLDVLMYNPSGREGKSTIVMGKYLNPRALLKYEQALESGAGFFVTLEYSLDGLNVGGLTLRNLRIETLVGTRQSGAEVSWSRDY
jgi:autotransporter translocation and assembly factor TamB